MNVLKKKVTSMEKSNMAQISSSMAIMSIHENPYLNLQKSNSCLQGNHFLTKASLKFFPSLRTTLYRCISNRLLPKIKMSFLSSPTCQPCIPQENPSNLKVFEFFSLQSFVFFLGVHTKFHYFLIFIQQPCTQKQHIQSPID